METSNLIENILHEVSEAQKGNIITKTIFSNIAETEKNNEFLFFIKPEITSISDSKQLEKILDLIFQKIAQFGFQFNNIKILSAKYLEQFNIIAQHYGVINKIASNAIGNISETAKENFEKIYDKKISNVKVLGGIEFVNKYSNFNPYSLDYLWQNLNNQKLAGGTYCEKIKVDDEIIYLINGFHPRQLKHFTEIGRSIIVMTLLGDLPWKEARNKFIGSTNPVVADEGSLRRELFDKKDELGLAEVSQGVNGVHLSAGPVEALIELKRYNSDLTKGEEEFTDFSFGKKLKNSFNDEQFNRIVNNDNVVFNGKTISIFDLTEEMDSSDAVEILKSVL